MPQLNCPAHLANEGNIGNRHFRIGADIDHGDVLGAELGNDFPLVREAGVVGSDGDFHGEFF
jgi:hypothetical protein